MQEGSPILVVIGLCDHLGLTLWPFRPALGCLMTAGKIQAGHLGCDHTELL